MSRQKIDWIVVPNNPETNRMIADVLKDRTPESEYSFVPEGEDVEVEGYLLPDVIGYSLITRLKRNRDASFRIFRKAGRRISQFDFSLLRKNKVKKLQKAKSLLRGI